MIKFLFIILVTLFANHIYASTPLAPLHIHHQWLMNKDGQVLIFRGVNLVIKTGESPKQVGFDARHAQFMQEHGFNLVRLGVLWSSIEPTPGQYNQIYLNDIKDTVHVLAQYGIYSLIDVHEDQYSQLYGDGAPAWATIQRGTHQTDAGFPCNLFTGEKVNIRTDINHAYSAFWHNEKAAGKHLQTHYIEMLKHLVAALKSEKNNLFGYDVMNEPYMGLPWRTCITSLDLLTSDPAKVHTAFGSGCQKFDHTLTHFYKKIVPVMQQIDPDTIVWYEPSLLVGLGAPIALEKVSENQVGLSFHNYNAATGFTRPIKQALHYQKKMHVPLYEGEFGATTDLRLLEKVLAENNKAMLSTTYWTYFNNPTFRFCNFGYLPVDPQKQGIIQDLHQSFDQSNVNFAMLNMLTEVYPMAISGTPINFSYNHQTNIFSMRFSPVNPNGKKVKLPTEIFVPAINYPTGYTVKVKNGTVLSAKNSEHLLIQANGRKEVIVQILKTN